MRNVAGFPVVGPVRTYRHEHAEWDGELGAWKTAQGGTLATLRPDGQVIESQTHLHDGSISRRAHTYDDEGRLVEEQSWTNDGPRNRVLHAYDAAGRPTVRTHVEPDGSRWEGETCTYDSTGRKTLTFCLPDLRTLAQAGGVAVGIGLDDDDADEGIFYDANHRLMHRITRSRDRDGRVLREVVLGGETPFYDHQADLGKLPPEERAKVDALLAQVFADRTLVSVEYTYDEGGHILERTMRMGSLSEDRTTYRYDDHDNPTDEITEHHSRSADIDDGGVLQTKEEAPREEHTRFEYQYDGHGNWTERIASSRTDPQADFHRSAIMRRTITYYG